MRKINLATELKKRLVNFLEQQKENGSISIGDYLFPEDLLVDNDSYADWLQENWNNIKELDPLVVRDFMTWSYLMDTEANASFKLEYFFNENI